MDMTYRPPGPKGRAFMLDDSFVRGIRGPVGSGTSSLCIMELFRRWTMQEPRDGKRRSRTAIIRNTSPELRTTTMKSYGEWLPESVFGTPKMAPPPFEHHIELDLGDGTELDVEVLFLALDRPEDMKKLLSLELTSAWINEAREMNKTIIDGVTQRLRRFPAWKDGGATWSGLIMDTNAPDDDHWWPIMAGEAPPPEWMSEEERRSLVLPADWKFWTQPPAVLERRAILVGGKTGPIEGYDINPLAENLSNLDPKYYMGQLAGKTKAWIDVYIRNQLGSTADGRPVHPDFSRDVHVAEESLSAVPGIPLILGVDFGLTPAAVFYQRIRNRWLALREIALTNANAVDLAKAINHVMATEFPGHKIGVAYGDPAGDERVGTNSDTPLRTLRAYGIPARKAAENNDPEPRRAAMSGVLRRLEEGQPALLVDPGCKVLIAGLGGSWCYKRVRSIAGGENFTDVPAKTRFSHTGEAAEYGLLGAGEARDFLLNKERKAASDRAQRPAPPRDPLARLRRQSGQGLRNR